MQAHTLRHQKRGGFGRGRGVPVISCRSAEAFFWIVVASAVVHAVKLEKPSTTALSGRRYLGREEQPGIGSFAPGALVLDVQCLEARGVFVILWRSGAGFTTCRILPGNW